DEHGSRTSGTGTGTDGSENRNLKKIGAGGGKVKGGEVDLGVVNSLLGEIPKDVMRESGGETLRVDGGPFSSRLEGIVVGREEMWDKDSQSSMLGH
ncbi:hypothetical protein Tco_1119107, partial [Tanacetum coccineum]